MSDKNANKADVGKTATEAGPETPEAELESKPESRPESSPESSEVMPGLAEQVEVEVIAQLEAECMQLKDRLLRALAESENVRRRAERDRKDAETYGGTRLARDLLAVHDAQREQAKGFIEGVELTLRELLSAFAKHRIEKVSPAMGEKFDPNRHQAMFEAPIPGAEPGTVIEVMQAGFNIAGRLLRPALVGVARAVPKPGPKPGPEPESEPKSETAEPEAAEAAPKGNGAD